jgi:hypothetical protein
MRQSPPRTVRVITLRTQNRAHSLIPAPLVPPELSFAPCMSEFPT